MSTDSAIMITNSAIMMIMLIATIIVTFFFLPKKYKVWGNKIR